MPLADRHWFGLFTNLAVAAVVLVPLLVWLIRMMVRWENRAAPETTEPGTLPVAAENARTARAQLASENDMQAARNDFSNLRRKMVHSQLRSRDIHDQQVLGAMQSVPRHLFVSEDQQQLAYADRPLPIGHGQTISQPYIVALMTQHAQPKSNAKALDIGTGSGYQGAVLAEVVRHVYSIEILSPLAVEAGAKLEQLGYKNIDVDCANGYRGWPEHAPFDLIIVAAAPDHIPEPLLEQLAPGGRLVIPVGHSHQELIVVEKGQDGTTANRSVAPVAFVPMTGEAMER